MSEPADPTEPEKELEPSLLRLLRSILGPISILAPDDDKVALEPLDAESQVLVDKLQSIYQAARTVQVYQTRHLVKHLRAAGVEPEQIPPMLHIVDDIVLKTAQFARYHASVSEPLKERLEPEQAKRRAFPDDEQRYDHSRPDTQGAVLFEMSATEPWYGFSWPTHIEEMWSQLEEDDLSDHGCGL